MFASLIARNDCAQWTAGALVLVNFLFRGALPWLALRQAPRTGNAAMLDISWKYFLPYFSITGKTNYKQMCVLVTRTHLAMQPAVKKWYDANRVVSWSGRQDSSICMDQAQEFANGLIKPGLEDSAQESINDYVTRISAIKEVEEQLLVALKNKSLSDNSFLSKSTRVELEDVAHLVKRFKQKLGVTFKEFSAKGTNAFGTSYAVARRSGAPGGFTSTPWKKVDTERVSDTLKKYIQTLTLDGAMPELFDDAGERLEMPPVPRNGRNGRRNAGADEA